MSEDYASSGRNQTSDSDLNEIATLSPSNDDIIQRKAGAWTNRTPAQFKTDAALNNVDNTSDANKPVSTAQQAALDAKQAAIQYKNEGSNLGTSGTVNSIDFVGAGVDVTRSTNAVTVTVSGGLGGSTGGTDNQLLRSDGTGGATLQNTGITVDDANNITGVAALTTTGNIAGGNAIGAGGGLLYIGTIAGAPYLQQVGSTLISVNSAAAGRCWIPNQEGRPRVTVNVTNATTTMSNITDLSVPLIAGRHYTGRMVLYVADSVAADGIKVDFDGGNATMTDFRAHGTIFDAALQLSSQSSAIATDFAVATLTGDSMVEIHFGFTCNAAGTFIPRFAQNAHTTGTATLYRGSFMIIQDSA